MDDEESERRRKLKAGREKLLQFQQKKSVGKKKKKTSSKHSKTELDQPKTTEIGGKSTVNEELEIADVRSVSGATATDKDVSSITSEVEEELQNISQEAQFYQSGGESTGASYASESYTSGEESYSIEDGRVDDLVIANLERNELKNRTVELEEELAAKKIALKDISNENTELKSKIENFLKPGFKDTHATSMFTLNEKISSLEKLISERDFLLKELKEENEKVRIRNKEMSESLPVEELQKQLNFQQATLDELNEQNQALLLQVQQLQSKLAQDDLATEIDSKAQDLSIEQLNEANEHQKSIIKSLEEAISQNKAQLQEYHKALHLKDQELQQVANSWKGYLSQNVAKYNEQLTQKDQQLNDASNEIAKLQSLLNEKSLGNDKVDEMQAKLEQERKEVSLLKAHIETQTEQLVMMQESLNDSNILHKDKDDQISALQQQADSLSQNIADMSNNSQTIAQQMIELRSVLDNRNERIAAMEHNLNEVEEEKELLKTQLREQTEDLLNQVKVLRTQLQESNTKVLEQTADMESSFSELYATNNMIKDLQNQIRDKDMGLEDADRKLQSTEEILQELQRKFVEEKERLQIELNEKDELFEKSKLALLEELKSEKSSAEEYHSKVIDLSAQVQSYQERDTQITDEISRKDSIVEDLRQRLDETEQNSRYEMESLKLELENVKEKNKEIKSEFEGQMNETSRSYQEELKQLQDSLDERENMINALKDKIEQCNFTISNAELGQKEAVERVRELEAIFHGAQQKHDEEIIQLKQTVERQNISKIEREEQFQNEMKVLKEKHAQELTDMESELFNMKTSFLTDQNRLQNEIETIKKQYADEMATMNQLNSDLTAQISGESNFCNVKEALQHQLEKKEKIVNLSESLALEQEKLIAEGIETKNELNVIESDCDDVDELHEKIKTLDENLAKALERENRLIKEKEDLAVLYQQLEETNGQKIQEAEFKYDKMNEILRDKLELSEKNTEALQAEINQIHENLQSKENELDVLKNSSQLLEESSVLMKEKSGEVELLLEETKRKMKDNQNEHNAKVQELEIKLLESQQNYEGVLTQKHEIEERMKEEKQAYESRIQNYDDKFNELDYVRKEKEDIFDKLGKAEEELAVQKEKYESELSDLREKLREVEAKQLHTSEVQKMHDNLSREYEKNSSYLMERVDTLEQSQTKIIFEKEALQEMFDKSQSELNEVKEEHEIEVQQMDEQLEQTRKVIELLKTENEAKILKLTNNLRETENQNEEMLHATQRELQIIKHELEKSMNENELLRQQLTTLTNENAKLISKERDLNSNNFGKQPIIKESIVVTDEWREVQGETGDSWDWPVDDLPRESKKFNEPAQLTSIDEMESIKRITVLQEKLAEKERSEMQLIEEKNKLLRLVKEYNDSLANERDSLKTKIVDQDETIQKLQEQLSMSEIVSTDLQQEFTQQLIVLEKQRDSLLNKLNEQQKERSTFVDILEEKHSLEENLRSEKEQLADKLRQKEVLEKQLDDERAALQEQLIRQARLNEIIREKDVLEQELTEQKNQLQLELSAIEDSLLAKQQRLEREKDTLREELFNKESEMEVWKDDLTTKEEKEREEREQLEKHFTETLLTTRSELENTYQLNLEHLKTELEDNFKHRLFDIEEDLQVQHQQEIASLSQQHEQQVSF